MHTVAYEQAKRMNCRNHSPSRTTNTYPTKPPSLIPNHPSSQITIPHPKPPSLIPNHQNPSQTFLRQLSDTLDQLVILADQAIQSGYLQIWAEPELKSTSKIMSIGFKLITHRTERASCRLGGWNDFDNRGTTLKLKQNERRQSSRVGYCEVDCILPDI